MNKNCPQCSGKVDPVWEKCPYCGADLRRSLLAKLVGLFGARQDQPYRVKAAPPASATDEAISRFGPAGEFRFEVEDVFSIKGRGTVVTGTIEGDTLRQGDLLKFTATNGTPRQCTVKGIETFRKVIDSAPPGTVVGILLSDVSNSEIGKGIVLIRA